MPARSYQPIRRPRKPSLQRDTSSSTASGAAISWRGFGRPAAMKGRAATRARLRKRCWSPFVRLQASPHWLSTQSRRGSRMHQTPIPRRTGFRRHIQGREARQPTTGNWPPAPPSPPPKLSPRHLAMHLPLPAHTGPVSVQPGSLPTFPEHGDRGTRRNTGTNGKFTAPALHRTLFLSSAASLKSTRLPHPNSFFF